MRTEEQNGAEERKDVPPEPVGGGGTTCGLEEALAIVRANLRVGGPPVNYPALHLYVAGDLDAEQSRMVLEHVATWETWNAAYWEIVESVDLMESLEGRSDAASGANPCKATWPVSPPAATAFWATTMQIPFGLCGAAADAATTHTAFVKSESNISVSLAKCPLGLLLSVRLQRDQHEDLPTFVRCRIALPSEKDEIEFILGICEQHSEAVGECLMSEIAPFISSQLTASTPLLCEAIDREAAAQVSRSVLERSRDACLAAASVIGHASANAIERLLLRLQ